MLTFASWLAPLRKVEDSAPDVRLKKKKDTLQCAMCICRDLFHMLWRTDHLLSHVPSCTRVKTSIHLIKFMMFGCTCAGFASSDKSLKASRWWPQSILQPVLRHFAEWHKWHRSGEELCNKWKNGQDCVLGRACPYAHGEKELGTVELVVCGRVKTRICKFWTTGNCRWAQFTGESPGESIRQQ